MSEPITGTRSLEWQLQICRPAFQDFQRILPWYRIRSELNRQLHKLRWWNPDEPLVIDLHWNRIVDSELAELSIDPTDDGSGGVRILFFEHSPVPMVPTLWILGGMNADEPLSSLQHAIFLGRSTIIKARVD